MCSFLRLCDHFLPRAEQISILKRLNHRHIVHLREVLASSTKLYLVMDYVNGGELFDLLEEQGALDEDVARRYFHQLVDAINYCHSVGVSHRDLKVRFFFSLHLACLSFQAWLLSLALWLFWQCWLDSSTNDSFLLFCVHVPCIACGVLPAPSWLTCSQRT